MHTADYNAGTAVSSEFGYHGACQELRVRPLRSWHLGVRNTSCLYTYRVQRRKSSRRPRCWELITDEPSSNQVSWSMANGREHRRHPGDGLKAIAHAKSREEDRCDHGVYSRVCGSGRCKVVHRTTTIARVYSRE